MNWEDFVQVVESYVWIRKEELGGIVQVIDLLLDAGKNNEDERSNAIASVKGLLKGREGSPFRQGVRSTKPISVKVNIDKVGKMVEEASKVYFSMVPNGLHLKHGKSGGGGFASAEEYAKVEKKKVMTMLYRRHTNGLWDGTLEGLGYGDKNGLFSEEE
ncbi:MAG: hypothetical protein GOVbin4206_37 [Prokaryotic dsDNA virus sp.]|nr:MAG: hypothetical protein GOVbin4206_37 [Prokaryotic dsDNA virus sp.]